MKKLFPWFVVLALVLTSVAVVSASGDAAVTATVIYDDGFKDRDGGSWSGCAFQENSGDVDDIFINDEGHCHLAVFDDYGGMWKDVTNWTQYYRYSVTFEITRGNDDDGANYAGSAECGGSWYGCWTGTSGNSCKFYPAGVGGATCTLISVTGDPDANEMGVLLEAKFTANTWP